eukprot:4694444-Amphidinium_carterae.1
MLKFCWDNAGPARTIVTLAIFYSGRADPHFRRFGVGYSLTLVNEPGSRCPVAGNRSSELHFWPLCEPWKSATPGVVSDCQGVVKALQAIQHGQKQPKGRHRDLGVRARNALTPACQFHWVKAHQTKQAVDEGRITFDDFQGNQEADEVANLGAAAHAAHEPTAEYLRWELVAQAVR